MCSSAHSFKTHLKKQLLWEHLNIYVEMSLHLFCIYFKYIITFLLQITLIRTPAQLLVNVVIQSVDHAAAQQIIKSWRFLSRASVNVYFILFMLMSNMRMGKSVLSVTFVRALVPDGLIWVFQKLLSISHTTVSRVYAQWCKKTKNILWAEGLQAETPCW